MLEKECDDVLLFLSKTPKDESNTKWWNYTLKPKFPNISKSDFESVLLILFNDKNITTHENRNPLSGFVEFLSITTQGEILLSKGGYTEKIKEEGALRAKAELLERNQMEYQKSQIQLNAVQAEVLRKQVFYQQRLNRWTIWIAVGTIIAAVAGSIAAWYYITQLILFYHGCH
jgi:hypothetical protein